MNIQEQFLSLLAQVRTKHGTLADAMRAGGVDPDTKEGKSVRRLIELKSRSEKHAPRAWDIWAIRGLLSLRKRAGK